MIFANSLQLEKYIMKKPQENCEEKICKICFEQETSSKPVISPCKCRGSSKYIHDECLRSWLSYDMNNLENKSCEICKHPYHIEISPRNCSSLSKKFRKNPKYSSILIILFLVFFSAITGIYTLVEYRSKISVISVYFGGIIFVSLILVCVFAFILDLLKRICMQKTTDYKIWPYSHSNVTMITIEHGYHNT